MEASTGGRSGAKAPPCGQSVAPETELDGDAGRSRGRGSGGRGSGRGDGGAGLRSGPYVCTTPSGNRYIQAELDIHIHTCIAYTRIKNVKRLGMGERS